MMLYGPDGSPISSKTYKKADQPKTGPSFGNWSGRDIEFLTLPGGGVVQFDLSRLTLSDFRTMRDHYQINASQSVLTFMVHQADWTIQCESQKIRDLCTYNMERIWTRLVRSISQAFWAGFSPNVLEWENEGSNTLVSKVKDLIPEECEVNWKEVAAWAPPGHAPPKIRIYDGIKQKGTRWPIPVENSFWYPILMENGNYWGRKLLRPAFTSWFFSILIHLFSNRYFERFGEPVPIGRAPFDDEVDFEGKTIKGNELMLTILEQLRNRSVVVLPNSRTPTGDNQSYEDYSIEYLESQMRGADFERYLSRLDEEMSLALFTPLLLLRTADVGSYNLGVGHMQMYLWMLNALLQDIREYVERYILYPIVNVNFGPNAPRPKLVFRTLGRESVETIRSVITELVKQGKVMPDLVELGQMTGMTLEEIEVITEDTDDSQDDNRTDRQKPKRSEPRGAGEPRATGKKISARMRSQVEKAFRENEFGKKPLILGFQRRFEQALASDGAQDRAADLSREFYSSMQAWVDDTTAIATQFESADEFMGMFDRLLDVQISEIESKYASEPA